MRDKRVCCAYQPKVAMRSGELVGIEVLMRWRDEDGVIQVPGDFIGLAVELGLIDQLTHYPGRDSRFDRPDQRDLRSKVHDQH